MTNDHVHGLVKFGFSARYPKERAVELSAPTGVPGKWIVEHYWEVEDGYSVEQAVYRKLSKYRLNRQEFFKLSVSEARTMISNVIKVVGINPKEQERLRLEAIARREAEEAALWEKEKLAKRQRQERMHEVRNEIMEAQMPLREEREKETTW